MEVQYNLCRGYRRTFKNQCFVMSVKNRKGKAWKIFRSNKHSGINSVIVGTGAFVIFEFQMCLWAVMESHGVWGSLNS